MEHVKGFDSTMPTATTPFSSLGSVDAPASSSQSVDDAGQSSSKTHVDDASRDEEWSRVLLQLSDLEDEFDDNREAQRQDALEKSPNTSPLTIRRAPLPLFPPAMKPIRMVYARSLSNVFPKLPPNDKWPNTASIVCSTCDWLGKQLGASMSRIETPVSIPRNLEDEIVGNALAGCRNCRFMLDCLRRAPFMDESRQIKSVRALTNFDKKYKLTIEESFNRNECELKLASFYTPVKPPAETPLSLWSEETDIEMSERLRLQDARRVDPDMRVYYLLASCSLVIASGKCCEPSTNGESSADRPAQHHNNFIDRNPRSAHSISIVLQWLKQCESHKNCPLQKDVSLPTRVIKVPPTAGSNPCLWVTSGASGKYIALSHCWGGYVLARTTLGNISMHEKEIILADLPNNFLDAVEVARLLRVSYLWIDSLCIIQDSLEDWAAECSKMSQVYANATLVIGAAAASDSTMGFLGQRSFLQGPQLDDLSRVFLREKVSSRKTHVSSPLSSRAWAYQESLLAPRLLLYTENQMVWECRQGTLDEGVNIIESSVRSCSKKQFYRAIDDSTPLLDLSDESIRLQSKVVISPTITSISNRLDTWYGCVEDYSHRELTMAFDKLPALSGLAAASHVPLMGDYLAGLWSKDLGNGLFWTRHIAREEIFDRQFRKATRYRAPSWSWASYDGPVNFRVDSTASKKQAITSDTLFNGNEWQTGHEPRLVEHNIMLATSDKYGQVLPGSYIVLEGLWKTMYPFSSTPTSFGKNSSARPMGWPSPHRMQSADNGSFVVRRDHPHGVQEKYAWHSTGNVIDSCAVLMFPNDRCLILKYVGNHCWARDGCCYFKITSYDGWIKSQFKLV